MSKKTPPVKLLCVVCGKEFVRLSSNQQVCSVECRLERNRRSKRSWKKSKDLEVMPETKICPDCGSEFPMNAPNRVYCPVCSEKRKASIAHRPSVARASRSVAPGTHSLSHDPFYPPAGIDPVWTEDGRLPDREWGW